MEQEYKNNVEKWSNITWYLQAKMKVLNKIIPIGENDRLFQ